MLRMMLGHLPFDEMIKTAPNFTPIFVAIFFFTVNYVWINMLVAVLNYYYSLASKHEKMREKSIAADDYKRAASEDGIKQVLLVIFPFLRNKNSGKKKDKRR